MEKSKITNYLVLRVEYNHRNEQLNQYVIF